MPEHVETRSLYNSDASLDLEQGIYSNVYNWESRSTNCLNKGKIQMWIDMFLLEDSHNQSGQQSMGYDHKYLAPPPVDVSLRKPKRLQLRIIIYNTKDVILDDYNMMTGERKSDIYVKGFIGPDTPTQKTDVHYRY